MKNTYILIIPTHIFINYATEKVKGKGGLTIRREVCGAPTEAPAEATEAVEYADG